MRAWIQKFMKKEDQPVVGTPPCEITRKPETDRQRQEREIAESLLKRLDEHPEEFKIFDKEKPCAEKVDRKALVWHVASVDESVFLRFDTSPAIFFCIGTPNPDGTVSHFTILKGVIVEKSIQSRLAFHKHLQEQDARIVLENLSGKLARTFRPDFSLPDLIAPGEGAQALREKILAMPAEEAQVSDALSAMQYGLRVQQAFAQATAAFTDHALASVDRLSDAGAAFDALVADLTGLAPGGEGQAPKPATFAPMTFAEIRKKLDGLGVKLDRALEQVLRRYGDVVQSADLFAACATALEDLVTQGAELRDRAKENAADYAEDLAAAVESVRMTRTVAEFQNLTVQRVLEAERGSVGALRRLAVNTLPLLGTQIAAAATLEGDRLSGSLSGKAGTVERMAVVANPLLAGEGGSDADLAALRARLVEQFSQAREALGEVQAGLRSARTLAIAQSAGKTPVADPRESAYDYEVG